MSDLRVGKYAMPGAPLGDDNPLPEFALRVLEWPDETTRADCPREMRAFTHSRNVLPYRMRDNYGRDRRPCEFVSVVLENDVLRATFLPELGGRLWSLVHKASGRELLDVNPVFQPTNLAACNAWISGGVEWNFGLRGHSPQTCRPVFAARVDDDRVGPVLRMYEWERTRCAPYQIDVFLPDGSTMLYVRVSLVNPHEWEIPMYWWSNIAVPERPDSRVLVPAGEAIVHGYDGSLDTRPAPCYEGVDYSYPTNSPKAKDWYYRIPEGNRPWIASLDADGCGLVQTSTSLLKGRKLFVWGMSDGGRHWQEFLSEPGQAYVEIQAGLALTQNEYLPMPPGARWEWLEAYGLMQADPGTVHGEDWPAAWGHVQARLDAAVSAEHLATELAATEDLAARAPREILSHGTGWGALEKRRREAAGEPSFCGPELAFPDEALGEAQSFWLELVTKGKLPSRQPTDRPGAWMVQPQWRDMLEEAVSLGRGDDWLSQLHLGVIYADEGRSDEAKAAWKASLAHEPSAWAYRNLAVLAAREARHDDAAESWLKARRMAPELLPLAVECCRALLRANRPGAMLELLGELPAAIASYGRIRVLEARAARDAGDYDRALGILQSGIVVPDLSEGERILSDVWYSVHERRIAAAEGVEITDELRQRVRREFPPSAELDFRMFGEPN